MEITPIHSSISKTILQFSTPSLHFPSQSFTTPKPCFHFSSTHSFKPLTTTFSSLSEQSTATTNKVATATDISLAVKKRAADLAPELKGTSIFLVGMKSSMKANLGKLLADALRYYFFDSDGLVEEAAGGESAAKAFRESDEKAFRESETEVLKQLSSMGRLVVCAGDGAVLSSTNLALLRHGISLWIETPLKVLAREMTEGSGQFPPDIDSASSSDEVLTRLAATYEEMKGGYATADATISLQKVAANLGYDDLDSVTTEDMTLEVLKEIGKLTRVKKMMEEAARPF